MPPDSPLPPGRANCNEPILVDRVWAEVRDRQAQSLHQAILLAHSKANPPACPWQGQLHLNRGLSQTLSSPTTVAEVFDRPDINHQLLILGCPGAGKTAALLSVAAVLIQRANNHPQAPIPVMFHLASWRPEQQALQDWLQAELRLKYGLSASLANQWLQANRLLPLLDGLDEMAPDRQVAAVQPINDWLKSGDGSRPILVCSSRDAYQRLPVKLALPGLLDLQPLTNQPLETYLKHLGLDHLWARLQRYPDLLALCRTPLWLSLLILSQDTLTAPPWDTLTTPQDWQGYLLEGFIRQQLQPTTANPAAASQPPTAQQTRLWLGWLAQQMQRQGQAEFCIEAMQPNLLSHRSQQRRYSLLGGLIFGLTGGLIFGLWVGITSGLIVSSLVGVLFLLTRGNDAIATLEPLDRNFSSFMRFILVRQINPLLFFILMSGLVVGMTTQGILGFMVGLLVGALIGLIVRSSIALSAGLIGAIIFGINHFFKTDISQSTKTNQGIWDRLRYGLRVTAMFMPLLVLIRAFPLFWARNLTTTTIAVDAAAILHLFSVIGALTLWAAIFDSALVCAQHLALRLVLYRANAIPWNYARFLNYGCERFLLQQVGGRYQFVHRFVQEWLAAMSTL